MPKFHANQLYRLVAAATTNANVIKAFPGTVKGVVLTNDSAAAKFVRLFDKATAPVAGTDTPILSFTVAANSTLVADLSEMGIGFDAGLGITITGAAGDADATAVVAADVIAQVYYR